MARVVRDPRAGGVVGAAAAAVAGVVGADGRRRGRRCGLGLVAAEDVDRATDGLRPHFWGRRRRDGGGGRPWGRGGQRDGREGDAAERREECDRGDDGGAKAHAHTFGSRPPSVWQTKGKVWQSFASVELHNQGLWKSTLACGASRRGGDPARGRGGPRRRR